MTATAPTPVEEPKRRHTWADLYHERTHFQFIERSWRWALVSGALILISVLAFAINGLNLGIDFDGGTQWQLTVSAQQESPSSGAVRDVLEPLGIGDAKILILGDDSVRVQSETLGRADQAEVTAALAEYAGIPDADVSLTNVGPTWGQKVSNKALTALVVFFLVIAVYLSFRFEWRMALAALVAVVHDIIITVGVYAVTGFEVTPATVVAFLTILGFSLYDTVVVFDKVKDNTARVGTVRGDTYSSMVNRSLNQVLIRSINTSVVALLPVASLLFVGTYVFGGLALRDFALALFVGLLTGCYSSIFVATPFLAWLKERQPRYRALRERAAADLAKAAAVPATPVVAAPGAAELDEASDRVPGDGDLAPAPAPAAPTPPTPSAAPASSSPSRGTANPRGRQQRRRKRR
jgi:preprotein translocase subunit SecF